jgi:hypothetical protein
MRSVYDRREAGKIIWNKKYEQFMATFGFMTMLNAPYSPWLKGRSERLVQYMKTSFIPGRKFNHLGDLNTQAISWCNEVNNKKLGGNKPIPNNIHATENFKIAFPFDSIMFEYLAVERKVSYDGFVAFEGYLFGTPLNYKNNYAYITRIKDTVMVYDLSYKKIATYNLDWMTYEYANEHQWDEGSIDQPEEQPTNAITCNSINMNTRGNKDPNGKNLFDFDAYDAINDCKKDY